MFKLWIIKISNKTKKSINAKYSLWIIVSLIISVVVGLTVVQVVKPVHFLKVHHVDYDKERYEIEEKALDFINRLYSEKNNKEEYIKNNITTFKGNIYIVDKDGHVQYKNENDGYQAVESININAFKNKIEKSSEDEFKISYPLTINKNVYYLIMIKNLNGVSTYSHEISYGIAAIIALILFVFLVYFGLRKKVKYIEYISSSIKEISKGNLKYELEIKGEDELACVSNEINSMEKSLLNMIEKERQNDKMQQELITNISHDLKTPLTIILGYLDIIRTKKYKTEEEENQYIQTSYEKTMLIQKMISKLFELVKLGDKETVLNRSDVNINKLLRQVITDHSPIADLKNINIEYKNSKNVIILNVDLDKICRVFNNLMNNAIKYSEKNENIIVSLEEDAAGAVICLKNKCKNIKEEDLDMLFNRFYRGDKARNSSVEGSGIGLSIVKRILELHNSSIWAELHDDEISFIIRLRG
ncbi:HAMP domain-containing sensor histidine kinase [Clostridium estertheticum]|uniref:HAMP domain-containing sensor histidine kinase n=1 Tax=Clostridium estertheticum TaxID=238834 RepID=UPI001CF47372|nr:HAMP domain-containing sensor histidine kinase [Clostridium estertheticum]MCB2343095.1 HAMP domain-containing histidine kinase [Clostridium estertheticum]